MGRVSALMPEVICPQKLLPLLDFNQPYDRAFVYGGRKSGKSRTMATRLLLAALDRDSRGLTGSVLAARATQASLADSMLAECRTILAEQPSLASQFSIGSQYLRTKSGRVPFVYRGTNINAASMKGITNAFIAGVDEADEVSEEGLQYLIPTIRGTPPIRGITFVFNPSVPETPMAKSMMAALDGACGRSLDENLYKSFIDPERRALFIYVNYFDNPFLSAYDLNMIEQAKREMDDEDFDCYFNGRFRSLTKGAYYAKVLERARQEGRIIPGLRYLPQLQTYCLWDLGRNDKMVAIVCQPWLDTSDNRYKLNFIDYIDGVGAPIQYYAQRLIDSGYANAVNVLPFDSQQMRGYNATETARDTLSRMGLKTRVIKNQGAGASWDRIVRSRTAFGRYWFSASENLKPLMVSLQNYAPKIVNNLPTSTPDHTYSDPADAFGLGAFVLEEIDRQGTYPSPAAGARQSAPKWSDGL